MFLVFACLCCFFFSKRMQGRSRDEEEFDGHANFCLSPRISLNKPQILHAIEKATKVDSAKTLRLRYLKVYHSFFQQILPEYLLLARFYNKHCFYSEHEKVPDF